MKRLFIRMLALAALIVAPAAAAAQCDDGELQCSVTIVCHDSYGDGWNGNAINVYQGETLRGSATITNGSDAIVEIAVCGSSDSLRFTWVSGNYSYETSYTILNGNDDTIHSGSGGLAGDIMALPVCPTCIKVLNLASSEPTNEGGTISWVGNETAQGYLVYLNGELTSDSPVTDTFYTFSGLEANTEYAVSVRSYCGGDDTAAAVSGSFRTLCQNGNCEVTLQTNDYSYAGTVEVIQNSSVIESVSVSYGNTSRTIEICNGDSLVMVYTAPSYSYGTTTWTVLDISGIELGTFDNTATTGDTVFASANACPSCIPPSAVVADSIGAHTASIHWTDNNVDGIGTYAIYVNGELVAEVSNDTAYDLTELSASTGITVGVARICEEGDTSGARTTTFRTDCGAVVLPYFENFDGLGFDASNGLPIPCWIRDDAYSCTTGGRTFPCGSADGSNPTMAFAADPEMTILICTDTIPVAGDSVFVSFRAQPSGNVDFWCGVMSDPHDSSTFIPIGAGIHTTNAPNQWGEYVFSTVGFSPDTAYRVAFKYTGHGYTGNWVNVDDIEIRVFDGCVRPMNLHVDTVSTESATIDWEVYGTESSWLLTVGDEEPVVVTDKPYTINGLEANTVYTVSIAALCATGDTTDAVSTSFRTPCEGDTCVITAVVPYVNYEIIQNGSSFGMVEGSYYGETYNVCYGTEIFLHTTETGSSYYDITITNAAGIELFNVPADSTLADTVNIGQPCPSCMPATNLAVSDITAEGCTFTWEAMNDENVEEWIVYVDGEALATPVTGTTTTISGLSANEDHTLGVRANCGDEDSSIVRTVSLHTLCAEGNCDFSVDVAGYYSGTINIWQDGVIAASMDYYDDGAVSLCLGSDITLVFQAPSYSYGGSYGFSVSKGDSNLIYVSDVSGYSTGDTILTFDGQCEATVYDVPDPVNPSSCPTPTNLTTTPDETSISITFNGTAYEYQVGIVAGNTWNEGSAEIDNTDDFEYTFSGLTAGTQYTIGVRAICEDYYGDEEYSNWTTVTVSTTSDTTPEVCNAPTNVQATNTDSTRAVISWTAGGDETAWEIMVNNDQQNLISATNTTYVMSNLTPSSEYKVRVRAVCSATATSGWSSELIFNTLAGPNGIAAVDGIACSLSPNPATSVVSIEASAEALVSIVDLNGREVYRSESSATEHRVDVSRMAKGAYFVRIVTEDGTAVRKLIVK